MDLLLLCMNRLLIDDCLELLDHVIWLSLDDLFNLINFIMETMDILLELSSHLVSGLIKISDFIFNFLILLPNLSLNDAD